MQAVIDEAGTPDRLRAVLANLEAIALRADSCADRVAATKVLLERVVGRAREAAREPIGIKLPQVNSAADLPAAYGAVVRAVQEGLIDADEAAILERLLSGYRGAFGEAELERKFRELEARIEGAV